ncbi:MAG: NAD(P)/FAD-dependent oxidoreductase [candidate division WOR-3 bacterium]|jgi:sarcosine oxidase subunit alpha
MKHTEIAIVGGGPAGLCAAIVAARLGARVTLIDDNPRLGGQLIKQTHKFFGSKSHYCGTRGIDIATILEQELRKTDAEIILNTTVIGHFQPNILGLASSQAFSKLTYDRLIIATGAYENNVLFENNDLPGVYGAGAVQTLMNVYGIRPGRRVLMVGSGNIGLIVSYQLLQAGIEVAAIVEALPVIGGYHVHAAKIRRLGIPILTSHTIKAALGREYVTGAVICRVDKDFKPVKGTEKRLKVDTICLAVGLSPLIELLSQINCYLVYIPELGGLVAWHNENLETSVPGVYVAGDVSGIEEASTAILEGRIAGANAFLSLKGNNPEVEAIISEAKKELTAIRQGPYGEKAVRGKQTLWSLKPEPFRV